MPAENNLAEEQVRQALVPALLWWFIAALGLLVVAVRQPIFG